MYFPLKQCAAVMMNLLLTTEPPQNGCLVFASTTATIHGNSVFLASKPFTIRLSDAFIPHSASRRIQVSSLLLSMMAAVIIG